MRALIVVVVGWVGVLPAAYLAADWRYRRLERRRRTPGELVQSTLGEQLRADQRRHRARWN